MNSEEREIQRTIWREQEDEEAASGKCPECSALGGRHHPSCTFLDEAGARVLLSHYYSEWLKMEERRRESVERFRKQAVFWQGKHAMLKQENNALRRKLHAGENKLD